jgi:hypothetical protein
MCKEQIGSMAKINATYGAGYYIDPSINYAQVEDAQRREGKKNRAAGVNVVMRQTFAAPFTIICTQCDGRTARGTHQYVNRKKSGDKFMGMPIWEIEFRCQHCMKYFCIATDWETPKVTGGYKCTKNCKRPESDEFVSRNLANQALLAERKQAVEDETLGGTGNMDALTKHNERMDRVHQLNAEIEARLAERQQCENTSTSDATSSHGIFYDNDDPLGVHFGEASSVAQQETLSLSGRLALQIRAKRSREESETSGIGVNADTGDVNGGDEDNSFAAFQVMLARENDDQKVLTSSPSSCAAYVKESEPRPAVADVTAVPALDLKALLGSAASNPFYVTFDGDNDVSGTSSAPTTERSSSHDGATVGGVVFLKKRRGKASSLFSQM